MWIGERTDRHDIAFRSFANALKNLKKDDSDVPWTLAYIRNNHVHCSPCQFLQLRMAIMNCAVGLPSYAVGTVRLYLQV